MIVLRPSLGLGDAVYMRQVIRHYLAQGKDVAVVTRHPGMYSDLSCQTINEADFIDCQVSARTKEPETNIYQDTLILAGIDHQYAPALDLRCVGAPRDYGPGAPVCVIRTPSLPVKGDETARCMVPAIEVYQRIVDAFRDRVRFVTVGWRVGYDKTLARTHLDLSSISVLRDYLAAVAGADLVLTQPGHIVPIAEALHKPLLVIFSSEGMASEEKRYRFTTPEKILTSPKSRWIVDDEDPAEQLRAFAVVLGGVRAPV